MAPENLEILRALYDSILILNDALPPEFQVVIADTRAADFAYSGELVVRLESPASISLICGDGAVACANNYIVPKWDYATATLNDWTDSSVLYIPTISTRPSTCFLAK